MHIQWTGEMAFWIFVIGTIIPLSFMYYYATKESKKKS